MMFNLTFKKIKYISKPLLVMIVMTIFLTIGIFLLLFWGFFFILFLFIFVWILSFAIYFTIVKEGVDYIDEGEIKNLIKILERREVIDFVRKLIYERSIENFHHIGREIDAKFNTSITQKKGMETGIIRDKRLYDKIEELYHKIINNKKK